MTFFSIITPTFNRSAQLPELINCVLSQHFNNFELIIVDDGSTDDTDKVVHDLIVDPRIQYYKLENNSGGPAYPRNYGVERSRGSWISFLDADDLWEANKLNEMHKLIEKHPSVTVFCHDEIMINRSTGDRRPLKYGPFTKNFYLTMVMEGNKLSTSATTVSRDFLLTHNIKFNEAQNYAIVEDYDFWLQIAKQKGQFYFHNKPLGYYVVDKLGISSNHDKSLINLSHVLNSHIQSIDAPDSMKKILHAKVEYSIEFSSAIYSLKNKKYQTFFSRIFHLFIKSPKLFSFYLLKRLFRVNL